MNTVNILDKAATAKKIDSIKGRDGTLAKDIQLCAIGALTHAAEYGDATLCTKLVKAVSAPAATQLRKYIGAFSPLVWNKKAGGFKKAKKGGAFRVSDAIETPWTDKVEGNGRKAAAYNGKSKRAALVKRLETLETEALEALDHGLLEIVQDALAALEAETATAKAA